jgi:GrpB-like predicted nucleotidyltransferase (UPF0157 family)
MIEIMPYQLRWPEEFRVIALGLRHGLREKALRIDHIGSTSVPGLAARDILDIQVSVARLDRDLLVAMQALGYARLEGFAHDHRPALAAGPESAWRKWLFNPPPDRRRANIHMRLQGRHNQRYPLLFRDYLRAHPASAAAYAELKRRLARHLSDPRMYAEVKDPAVDLIYLAAGEWASAANWQPGPSDV